MLKWLLKIIRKLTMAGYEDIMQRAADYQSIYGGNQFQCMKTNDLNDHRLGEVFTLRTIEPLRNGQIVALLSDGSRIPIDAFNASFSMITEQTPAMNKMEVRAMHARLKQSSELPAALVQTLDPAQQAAIEQKQAQQTVAATGDSSALPGTYPYATGPVDNGQKLQINGAYAEQGIGRAALSNGAYAEQGIGRAALSNESLSKDLFGMFTLAPTDLEFTVTVELPKLELIQMMYTQSSDKDEFLAKFSSYVAHKLDTESIKKSLSSLMEPKAKKIRANKN